MDTVDKVIEALEDNGFEMKYLDKDIATIILNKTDNGSLFMAKKLNQDLKKSTTNIEVSKEENKKEEVKSKKESKKKPAKDSVSSKKTSKKCKEKKSEPLNEEALSLGLIFPLEFSDFFQTDYLEFSDYNSMSYFDVSDCVETKELKFSNFLSTQPRVKIKVNYYNIEDLYSGKSLGLTETFDYNFLVGTGLSNKTLDICTFDGSYSYHLDDLVKVVPPTHSKTDQCVPMEVLSVEDELGPIITSFKKTFNFNLNLANYLHVNRITASDCSRATILGYDLISTDVTAFTSFIESNEGLNSSNTLQLNVITKSLYNDGVIDDVEVPLDLDYFVELTVLLSISDLYSKVAK